LLTIIVHCKNNKSIIQSYFEEEFGSNTTPSFMDMYEKYETMMEEVSNIINNMRDEQSVCKSLNNLTEIIEECKDSQYLFIHYKEGYITLIQCLECKYGY